MNTTSVSNRVATCIAVLCLFAPAFAEACPRNMPCFRDRFGTENTQAYELRLAPLPLNPVGIAPSSMLEELPNN